MRVLNFILKFPAYFRVRYAGINEGWGDMPLPSAGRGVNSSTQLETYAAAIIQFPMQFRNIRVCFLAYIR